MPQDLSGQNLRGRSFQGRDLTGTNFSYADIRGVDFTDANLFGVNFSHAKAGLRRRWIIFWIGVAFLLSALSGFICASTNGFAWWRLGDAFQQNSFNFSAVMLGLFAVFFFISVHKGLTAGLGALLLTWVATAALTAAGTATNHWHDGFFRWTSAIAAALAVGIGVAGAIAGTVL
jgi:hypothetical protein